MHHGALTLSYVTPSIRNLPHWLPESSPPDAASGIECNWRHLPQLIQCLLVLLTCDSSKKKKKKKYIYIYIYKIPLPPWIRVEARRHESADWSTQILAWAQPGSWMGVWRCSRPRACLALLAHLPPCPCSQWTCHSSSIICKPLTFSQLALPSDFSRLDRMRSHCRKWRRAKLVFKAWGTKGRRKWHRIGTQGEIAKC